MADSSNSNSSSNTNVGLIVGLVVGLVGCLIVGVLIFFGVKAYKHHYERIRSDQRESVDMHNLAHAQNEHERIMPPKITHKKKSKRIIQLPTTPHLIRFDSLHYDVFPPVSHDENPAGAICTTSLEYTMMHDIHTDPNEMPEVENK